MATVQYAEGYEWMGEKNYTEDALSFSSCDREVGKNEVFIGNTSGDECYEKGVTIPSRLSFLKSIRLGEQAYDIHGKPLNRDYCRPMILHKSDYGQYEAYIKKEMEEYR